LIHRRSPIEPGGCRFPKCDPLSAFCPKLDAPARERTERPTVRAAGKLEVVDSYPKIVFPGLAQ
jgi:hypothetical protein